VVRSDIRSSFGSSSTTAAGVPLTIRLAILDLANGCAPLAGAAVYLWHCDRDGIRDVLGGRAGGELPTGRPGSGR
jgi:protocatechuate 3,4-dioxygenase beta subunit